MKCSKVEKPKVARDVVTIWRQLNPPGRFLQRKDDNRKGPGSVQDDSIIWVEVDDTEARKKASQCLREKTPDVQPYFENLNQQQEEVTEKDKSTSGQHQMKANEKSTPDSIGSVDMSGPAPQRSGLVNMPESQVNVNSNYMRRGGIPDRPMSVNAANIRRGSMPALGMPALVHSTSEGFTGMPSGAAHLRMQDRRTSLPAANQMQAQQARVLDMERLMVRQEKVLRDAYTAIERTGDASASNLAGMQVQQQLQSTRQLMMQEQFLTMKARMLEARNGQGMPHLMEASHMGMPQQANGPMGYPQQMNGHTQRLLQEQQWLAREQQRLILEQERLVRHEHVLASMAARSQQVKPSAVVSGPDQRRASLDDSDDLEPLPINHDIYVPLSSLPDVQTSEGGSQFASLVDKTAPEETTQKENLKHKKTASANDQDFAKSTTVIAGDNQTNDTRKTAGEKTDRIGKPSGASKEGPKDENDAKDALLEYRKTLESYITTNQGSMPSLDMNDDGTDQVGQTFNGLTTTEWIEEQLLNDSGLHSSSDLSNPKRRASLQRSNSKKSMMSVGTGTSMSFALSDMDYSVDLSTKGDSKRNGRSMSILSHNSHLSELTDFDDLETL
jgi:hypothetical protein